MQKELNDICTMWNIHHIRRARSTQHVGGIPDYIPECQGTMTTLNHHPIT